MRAPIRTRSQAALAAALLTSSLLLTPTPLTAQGVPQPAVDRHGDPLPAGAVARFGTLRFRQGGQVSPLTVSPDGKLVVSSGSYGAFLWERHTGRLLRRLPEVPPTAECRFSADGKLLLVNRGKEVELQQVRTGKRVSGFRAEDRYGYAVALSPDAKTVAVACYSFSGKKTLCWVSLRDAATGKELRSFGKYPAGIDELAFTPDGKSLLTVSWQFSATLLGGVAWVERWDVKTGKSQAKVDLSGRELWRLTVTPDGKTALVALNRGKAPVELWDLDSGRQRPGGIKSGWTLHLALTPDSRYLATCGEPGIQVWEMATRREVGQLGLEVLEARTTWALALTPDSKTVITADRFGALHSWDVATGKEVNPRGGPSGPQTALAFSPDGKLVASSGEGAEIHLWEAATGKEVRRLQSTAAPSSTRIFRPSLAFTPDGKTLVSEGGILWDVRTGRELSRLQPQPKPGENPLFHPAVSPDGRFVACTQGSGVGAEIVVYDRRTGKELGRFGKAEMPMGPLVFSPDGKTLVSGKAPVFITRPGAPPPKPNPDDPESHTAVLLWEVASGQLRASGRGPRRVPVPAGFSPDGSRVFGIAYPGGYAWEAGTGKRTPLPGSAKAVDLAVLAGGSVIALARDGDVELWDLGTERRLARLPGHRGRIQRIMASPDGRMLATAGGEGSVLVWDVQQVLKAR
jgi:WD40 repeat protein